MFSEVLLVLSGLTVECI